MISRTTKMGFQNCNAQIYEMHITFVSRLVITISEHSTTYFDCKVMRTVICLTVYSSNNLLRRTSESYRRLRNPFLDLPSLCLTVNPTKYRLGDRWGTRNSKALNLVFLPSSSLQKSSKVADCCDASFLLQLKPTGIVRKRGWQASEFRWVTQFGHALKFLHS